MVVPGGDPYGNISGMSIVSPEKGYFVGYAGWGDNTLYAFTPGTGEVGGPANALLDNINIAGLESGAYVDKNGMLWVSDQTNARLVILDTETDEIDEIIDTGLNPIRVAFTTQGGAGSGSSSSDSSGGCFINSSTGSVSFWK
jgi:DNA-binding beta-propeller fold protein YncE